MNILFALDSKSEEVIVSDSPKDSNEINFIERIKRHDNETLYNAIVTLTGITKDENFDIKIFKAMDKICYMMYIKHKKI